MAGLWLGWLPLGWARLGAGGRWAAGRLLDGAGLGAGAGLGCWSNDGHQIGVELCPDKGKMIEHMQRQRPR